QSQRDNPDKTEEGTVTVRLVRARNPFPEEDFRSARGVRGHADKGAHATCPRPLGHSALAPGPPDGLPCACAFHTQTSRSISGDIPQTEPRLSEFAGCPLIPVTNPCLRA